MSSSTGEELSQSEDFSGDISQSEEIEKAAPLPKKIYPKGYKLHGNYQRTLERNCPEVEPPAPHVLTDEEFYDPSGRPNVHAIKEHLKKEGRISTKQFNKLIEQVYTIFCSEDNILFVDAPLTVCGDIHGQYYDLLKLFEVGGDPEVTRYLFLGDYVDRGHFSVECIILLFVYKVLYPSTFAMIRGNHECRHLTEYFTFKEECQYKYDIDIYEGLMDTFDALPIAAIMNKQFFCVHGGLSPLIKTIQQIQELDRFTETPPSGPMCDLLWSDPMEEFHAIDDGYEFNSVRGCSWNYGFGAVCEFLETNKLLSVIRAHEAQDAGYKMYRRNEKTGFPSVITLFSAPNYLDSYNNKGAVMRYENNVINIRQFNCSPHPYFLPGFMNVFAWSLPFVAEKLGELLMAVFRLVDDVEAEQEELADRVHEEQRQKKVDDFRSKVRGVSRIVHVLKMMREEREKLVVAGPLSANGIELPPDFVEVPEKPPTPLRSSLRESLKDSGKRSTSLASLPPAMVRELDRSNEARPPTPVKQEPSLRSSHDGITRKASRDNILLRKKSSGNLNIQDILAASHNTTQAPHILEQKIDNHTHT